MESKIKKPRTIYTCDEQYQELNNLAKKLRCENISQFLQLLGEQKFLIIESNNNQLAKKILELKDD